MISSYYSIYKNGQIDSNFQPYGGDKQKIGEISRSYLPKSKSHNFKINLQQLPKLAEESNNDD